MKLKLHQLESFLQVAQAGSFRAAADATHRSPSAISTHVRQLEEQLDVLLFERTTRRMTLTAAGRKLLQRYTRVLAELDAAAHEVRDDSIASRHRVSVGVSPSLSRHHLLPVFTDHQKRHPELSLHLHEAFAETLYTQVADRTTDFAIGPGIADMRNFHVRPIVKDPIVAVLPRKVVIDPAGTISLEAIAAHPQICMPRGTAIRQVIEAAFKAQGIPFNVNFEVMYPQGLFEMVAASLGVAMMPLLSVPPGPHRGFRIAPLARSITRDMCLITLKSRKASPHARELADRITAALKISLSAQRGRGSGA